jgi:hypothetical protein
MKTLLWLYWAVLLLNCSNQFDFDRFYLFKEENLTILESKIAPLKKHLKGEIGRTSIIKKFSMAAFRRFL